MEVYEICKDGIALADTLLGISYPYPSGTLIGCDKRIAGTLIAAGIIRRLEPGPNREVESVD